mgnify:FL=1
MNSNSKKTLVVTSALCALLAVGGTVAYFTDRDDAVNKIDIGQVKIDLTEPEWDASPDDNGDTIPDDVEDVVPTQEITKDPMVTNKGVNDAYIYVSVSFPKENIYTANTDGTKNAKAVTQLFTPGAIGADWTLLSSDTSDAKVNTYVYGYNKVVAPTASTSKLFETVTFCNAIEGQGLENTVQNINVKAFGIQSDNTGTMKGAYTKYINQNK